MLVSRDGIQVNPKKVEVVRDWPKPKYLTELRRCIGFPQFLRRFIKKFSCIASPLAALTKKNMEIRKWDKECDEAFAFLIIFLTSAPIIVSNSLRKPFRYHFDASKFAPGETFTQLDDNDTDRVVDYFFNKKSDAEQKYTSNELELLVLVPFLKRLRFYLKGSSFEVFTDNQVLKYLFSMPQMNRLESNWLELFEQFEIKK